METYKKPKFKIIKKRTMEVPVARGRMTDDDLKITDLGTEAKRADMPSIKKMRISRPIGNIDYIKSTKPKKANIIDARAETDEAAKGMLDRSRLEVEKNVYRELLKKMKKLD